MKKQSSKKPKKEKEKSDIGRGDWKKNLNKKPKEKPEKPWCDLDW